MCENVLHFVCFSCVDVHLIYIQNHPSVLIYFAVHHEVFTAGALEAQVCRTSAFRSPAGKPSDARWVMYTRG